MSHTPSNSVVFVYARQLYDQAMDRNVSREDRRKLFEYVNRLLDHVFAEPQLHAAACEGPPMLFHQEDA